VNNLATFLNNQIKKRIGNISNSGNHDKSSEMLEALSNLGFLRSAFLRCLFTPIFIPPLEHVSGMHLTLSPLIYLIADSSHTLQIPLLNQVITAAIL